MLDGCPKCSSRIVDPIECPKCGIVFRKYYEQQDRQREALLAAERASLVPKDPHSVSYFHPKINFLSLPVAFALAWIANWLTFTKAVGWYFFTIPTHEMGHTLAAWMGSRVAFPLGALIPMAGFTMIAQQRWMPFFFLQGLLLLVFGSKSIYWKKTFLTFLIGIYLALLCLMSWALNEEQLSMLVTLGGISGEFILSTIMILGFYHDLGQKIRWDFFRFFFLAAGSFTFIHAYTLWDRVRSGAAQLPVGSFLNGEGDSSGDVDKLISNYSWMPRALVDYFYHLAWACIVLIMLHYIVYAIWSVVKSRSITRENL